MKLKLSLTNIVPETGDDVGHVMSGIVSASGRYTMKWCLTNIVPETGDDVGHVYKLF